jgi:hypothetical protein
LKTKFRTVAVPVVIWEPDSFLDMGMTSKGNTSGKDNGQTQVGIINPGHPLAANMSGSVTVMTASSTFSWGKPNANAATIATQPNDATRSVIFAYESGSTMPGLVAPARRVALFLSDTTPAAVNDNGWALFDAAIRWAVGN